MSNPEQFPLSFRLDREATFDNFLSFDSGSLVQTLKNLVTSDNSEWIYIAGERGNGVSHLLHATIAYAEHHGHRALCFDFRWIIETAMQAGESSIEAATRFVSELFEGCENYDVLCIDHLDSMVERQSFTESLERIVFYQLTRIQQKRYSKIVFGAHNVVSEIKITLPDLRSRLSLAAPFRITRYSDEQKQKIIAFRCARRGLYMPDEVSRYIVERYSRDMSTLINYVNHLDRQALANARRLTVPFVKHVLDNF